MDKIVSVVHGNCDFDPIRFRAKIAIFDFDSIIVTSLKDTVLDKVGKFKGLGVLFSQQSLCGVGYHQKKFNWCYSYVNSMLILSICIYLVS